VKRQLAPFSDLGLVGAVATAKGFGRAFRNVTDLVDGFWDALAVSSTVPETLAKRLSNRASFLGQPDSV